MVVKFTKMRAVPEDGGSHVTPTTARFTNKLQTIGTCFENKEEHAPIFLPQRWLVSPREPLTPTRPQ